MALSSTTLQPAETTHNPSAPTTSNAAAAPLLAALVLSVYAAQKSNKQFRKLKRKAAFTILKLKLKESFQSLFSKKREAGGISTNTLLYILLGLLVLILLLTISWQAAIILLLAGILLLLLLRK